MQPTPRMKTCLLATAIAICSTSSAIVSADSLDNIYSDILGRKADAAGKAYWQGEIDNGTTLKEIKSAMKNSSEYLNKQSSSTSGSSTTTSTKSSSDSGSSEKTSASIKKHTGASRNVGEYDVSDFGTGKISSRLAKLGYMNSDVERMAKEGFQAFYIRDEIGREAYKDLRRAIIQEKELQQQGRISSMRKKDRAFSAKAGEYAESLDQAWREYDELMDLRGRAENSVGVAMPNKRPSAVLRKIERLRKRAERNYEIGVSQHDYVVMGSYARDEVKGKRTLTDEDLQRLGFPKHTYEKMKRHIASSPDSSERNSDTNRGKKPEYKPGQHNIGTHNRPKKDFRPVLFGTSMLKMTTSGLQELRINNSNQNIAIQRVVLSCFYNSDDISPLISGVPIGTEVVKYQPAYQASHLKESYDTTSGWSEKPYQLKMVALKTPYNKSKPAGYVMLKNMWHSFSCGSEYITHEASDSLYALVEMSKRNQSNNDRPSIGTPSSNIDAENQSTPKKEKNEDSSSLDGYWSDQKNPDGSTTVTGVTSDELERIESNDYSSIAGKPPTRLEVGKRIKQTDEYKDLIAKGQTVRATQMITKAHRKAKHEYDRKVAGHKHFDTMNKKEAEYNKVNAARGILDKITNDAARSKVKRHIDDAKEALDKRNSLFDKHGVVTIGAGGTPRFKLARGTTPRVKQEYQSARRDADYRMRLVDRYLSTYQ